MIVACYKCLHFMASYLYFWSFYSINKGKSEIRAIIRQNPRISSRTNHSLQSWLGHAKVPCIVICSRPAPFAEATSQPDRKVRFATILGLDFACPSGDCYIMKIRQISVPAGRTVLMPSLLTTEGAGRRQNPLLLQKGSCLAVNVGTGES